MKREWLIAYRKAKGLSQKDISDALNIGQSCYANYENGTRDPKPLMAKKISKVFGFDWTKFYEENDIQSQNQIEKEEGE